MIYVCTKCGKSRGRKKLPTKWAVFRLSNKPRISKWAQGKQQWCSTVLICGKCYRGLEPPDDVLPGVDSEDDLTAFVARYREGRGRAGG